MPKNMGSLDRILRVVAAIVIAVLIANGTLHGPLQTLLGVIAIIFLGTSLVGFCPAYKLVGIDTCGNQK